jgi:dipeptidase E
VKRHKTGHFMPEISLFHGESMPDNSMANAEKWAASLPVPAYAIDGQTAIKVADGTVEVVSDGHWKHFPR